MTLQQRMGAFLRLKTFLDRYFSNRPLAGEEGLHSGLRSLVEAQYQYNGWFTKEFVEEALANLSRMLEEKDLRDFCERIPEDVEAKLVAVICAGNIPLVCFHDVLCVLLSGHKALIKPSEDDKWLLPFFLKLLVHYEPGFEQQIRFADGKLAGFEAVIATGSNNTAKHFEYYFSKYPRIIRKNRTSVAILKGDESAEEFQALGKDIFTYFGLGCRNVSKLLVPKGYDFHRFFEGVFSFGELVNNKKYGNNYDYHRSLYLLESIPFLDNNFLILRQNNDLHSPISVLYYQEFDSDREIADYLVQNKDQLQCVVGMDHVPFGCSQRPVISDFADGVDTLNFLVHL